MRILLRPPAPPRHVEHLLHLTIYPKRRKSEHVTVTWCRAIADAVATAAEAPAQDMFCRWVGHPALVEHETAFFGFRVKRRTVQITAQWDEPDREPAFALHLDGRPVSLADHTAGDVEAVLSYAIWDAVTRPGRIRRRR